MTHDGAACLLKDHIPGLDMNALLHRVRFSNRPIRLFIDGLGGISPAMFKVKQDWLMVKHHQCGCFSKFTTSSATSRP